LSRCILFATLPPTNVSSISTMPPPCPNSDASGSTVIASRMRCVRNHAV
jgi:hypothetical protein